MKDSLTTEEGVVSKVAELMETLDHVKKYNMLARSLKSFGLIVVSSLTLFSIMTIIVEFLNNNSAIGTPAILFALAISLLIPIIGVVGGIVFVRKRVNSVKAGNWREELQNGFPSAIKLLIELDWEDILDEISIVKLSYGLYGFLKTVAYGVIIFFGVEIGGSALAIVFLGSTSLSIVFLCALLSLLIVFWVVGRDLIRRYKEIEALNLILIELRWFSLEFSRLDF